jgi:hypothetical protein
MIEGCPPLLRISFDVLLEFTTPQPAFPVRNAFLCEHLSATRTLL